MHNLIKMGIEVSSVWWSCMNTDIPGVTNNISKVIHFHSFSKYQPRSGLEHSICVIWIFHLRSTEISEVWPMWTVILIGTSFGAKSTYTVTNNVSLYTVRFSLCVCVCVCVFVCVCVCVCVCVHVRTVSKVFHS
jgi:hypothetical protein